MEGHEVFISYDKRDQITADAICHYLEDNNIKCWLKNRDSGLRQGVEEIMEAISKSKVVVLVFSEYSKHSNHVKTEVDLAFTEQIPILAFKIEESELEGGLEFFLSNTHWLDAYPNSNVKFENLIRDTSKLLGKPVTDIVISDEAKRLEEESDDLIIKRSSQRAKQKFKDKIFDFVFKRKIPIIAIALILIIASGILAFTVFDDGMGGSSAAEKDLPKITMKITDFHVDDVRNESTAWNYSYFVSGTLMPLPNEGDGYKINVDFYDKSGTLVDSTETNYEDAQKVSEGFLFGSAVSDKNNIDRVEAQLVNDKNIVIAQSDSKL